MNAQYKARLQAQLTAVDAAIAKIEKAGQSASFSGQAGSQSVTHGDLNTLIQSRTRLEKQLFGGIRSYNGIGA